MRVDVVELSGSPSEMSAIAADLRLEAGLHTTKRGEGESDAGLLAILPVAPQEAAIAAQALERGVPIVWAAAPDIDVLDWFVGSGGRAFAPGRIRYSEAGQVFLKALRDDAVGRILSLYVAVRGARAHAGNAPAFGALLWDAICFADGCLNEPILDLHAAGGALFSAEQVPDTAAIVARAAGGAILTVDVSLCLPAMLPPGGPAEVEIEAVGTRDTLRAAPFARSVQLRSDDRVRNVFWGENPASAIIAAAAEAVQDNEPPEPDRRDIARRIAMVRAVTHSLATGEGVSLATGASA